MVQKTSVVLGWTRKFDVKKFDANKTITDSPPLSKDRICGTWFKTHPVLSVFYDSIVVPFYDVNVISNVLGNSTTIFKTSIELSWVRESGL